jgi:hypothetical protein
VAQTGDGMNSDEYDQYLSKRITFVYTVDPILAELVGHNIYIPVQMCMYWGGSMLE